MKAPSRPLLALCVLCAAVVAGFLIFGVTDLVTTAPGQVRPAGEARPVQTARAGRVQEWPHPAHAAVRRGEVIARLDTREDDLRLQALDLAIGGLGTDEARLAALLNEFGPPDCVEASALAGAEPDPLCQRDIASEDEQHERERTLEREERAAAAATLASLQGERDAVSTRLTSLATQARWLQPACRAHRELARSGRIAAVTHWESERRCAEDEGAIAVLVAEQGTLALKLDEERGSEQRRRASVRQQWGMALATARRERRALEAERALLLHRVEQALLRAPADGRLHCERPDYADVWIATGEVLCQVVPEVARAEVIAQLPEQDHEGVFAGQDVSLRILALPWIRYGALPGRVQGIAPDARLPEVPGAAPAYSVTVIPKAGHPLLQQLAPGMRVEVDFHRGREPLWRWLIAPVAEAWLRAGREP